MKEKINKLLNKKFASPITCLTSYSANIAKILDGNIDMVLIGDSLGTTLYGMKNTQEVTLKMMKEHGKAVTKNIKKSITVIDMPYKTYENQSEALKNANILIKYTKAKMLKLEINKNNVSIVKHLSNKKFNVIAHIGVTPQSYNNFSKIKIVGKKDIEKKELVELAIKVEKAGAKCILLECVSQETAKKITSLVSVPTIGIGSSKFCDGQVLVFDDLVNINNNQKYPKFVKNYMNFENLAKKVIKNFSVDVKTKKFPSKKNSY